MAATVTATGTAGPGLTVTAQVFSDIVDVEFDCVANNLILTNDDGRVITVNITAATTITVTKSGSTYTFTISS